MSVRYVKDFTFDPAFGFTGSARGRADARSHPADADDNEYGDGSFVENPPALAKEKGMARGGRAPGKPSPAHPYNDPKGYQTGGPAVPMPTGRATGVPGMGMPPGVGPAAGPMARMPGPAPSAAPAMGGGPLSNATMTMPVHDAARLAHGLVQAGRVGGIRQAIGNAAAARGAAQARMHALAPGAAANAPIAAPPPAPMQQGIPGMARGGHHITAKQRHALAPSEFVFPETEGYPVDTKKRAKSALSRAAGNLGPAGEAKVRRKVHAEWPSIELNRNIGKK